MSHEQISYANPEVLFTAILRTLFFSRIVISKTTLNPSPLSFGLHTWFEVARCTYGLKYVSRSVSRVNPRGIRLGKSVNRRDDEEGVALRAPSGPDD